MNNVLEQLDAVLQQRRDADPETSYVAALYSKGDDAVLGKVSEEAGEFIHAAEAFLSGERNQEQREHLIAEAADLWFHSLVLLAHCDMASTDILQALQERRGVSGHEEKRSRTNILKGV